jgi:tRNA wybutosine-synthesizing protein 3
MKDKSPQGFYDKDIIPLLDLINAKEEYETTSSCSGRITLMTHSIKGETKWVFKSHKEVDYKEIINSLEEEYFKFIFDPLIIHIKCISFEKASELLVLLQKNGFKKTTIISTKHFVIEINDTGRMESLVNNSLSEDYIKELVLEANKRLNKTKENIKKLKKII